MLKTIKLNWKPGDYFEDLRQIGACLDNPRKKLGPVSFSLELLSVQKKKKKKKMNMSHLLIINS